MRMTTSPNSKKLKLEEEYEAVKAFKAPLNNKKLTIALSKNKKPSTVTQAEDKVVAECKSFLKKGGWITKTVYVGGIPLGFGKYATNPLKGFPDCLAFHEEKHLFLAIEFKKGSGGIVSLDQKYYHDLLRASGVTVLLVSSLDSLKEQLCQIGSLNQVA